jgi:glycosyltransferase involved in cell wall biosynthesis
MVKYSICIMHYNNNTTLKASLESILSQIAKDFEVVLVDNYSDDGSKEISDESHATRRIRLIRKLCSRGL